jgi:small subunit ribosomal protein S20
MQHRRGLWICFVFFCVHAKILVLVFLWNSFMANSAQARKRARQADKQRSHNASLRSTLRTAIKRVRQAIEAGDKAAAQGVFQQSVAVLDRIADKKIVHKNKASRTKSRLSAQVKALVAA